MPDSQSAFLLDRGLFMIYWLIQEFVFSKSKSKPRGLIEEFSDINAFADNQVVKFG